MDMCLHTNMPIYAQKNSLQRKLRTGRSAVHSHLEEPQQGGSGAALRALAQDSLDCVPSAIPFVSCIIRLNLSVTQFSHVQSRNNIYFLGVLWMTTRRDCAYLTLAPKSHMVKTHHNLLEFYGMSQKCPQSL